MFISPGLVGEFFIDEIRTLQLARPTKGDESEISFINTLERMTNIRSLFCTNSFKSSLNINR